MFRTRSPLLFVCLLLTPLSYASARIPGIDRPTIRPLSDLVQPKPTCCGSSSNNATIFAFAPETYKLTATYYSLKDNLSTTLMLNNKGPQPILAVPTIYSLSGTRLNLAPITVPGASYIDVNMHQLLAGQPEFREGSMKISYEGGNQQLGAQVKMVDAANKLIWAEQFVYTSKFTSSRLENVWWLPFENSKTHVVVSNTSGGAVNATITVDGTSPQQSIPLEIVLAPWETRVLEIMRDILGNENGELNEKGGISITHTGSPGAVLARMFIAKPNKGYSAALNFIDPDSTASQKWHGNGLRFRNLNGAQLSPVIAVRNTGDQTSHVSGKIIYTQPNGEVATINLPQKTIAAGSTKSFELENFIDDLLASVTYAGIEIDYDTPKGSIITSVQSVSQNGDHVFQVPMLDPGNLPSSAAGFPWKADGDFTTVVYIKNETDLEQKYTLHLIYDGGQYSLGVNTIKPQQTVALDFREIRNSQTPDNMGRTIPLGVERGQIAWSVKGKNNKVLTARSEQISLSEGVSSTYACYNCCPDAVYQTEILPSWITLEYGTNGFLGPAQTDISCYSTLVGPYIPSGVFWNSDNPTVVSVYDGNLVSGDVGTATVSATWETCLWWVLDGQCNPVCDQRTHYSSAAVVPTASISQIKAVGKDQTALIRVMTNNPENNPIALTLAPKPQTTGSAQFTSNNSNTRTITSTTNVEIKGITESSTVRGMRLEAKYTNSNNQVVSLATMDFTVVKATLALRFGNNDTVSTDNIARLNYSSVVGTFNLGGPRLTPAPMWVNGIEIVATLLPSNVDDLFTLERVYNSRLHNNQTLIENYAGCPDRSQNAFYDNDPQSNGSQGTVYDLDAPGLNIPNSAAPGTIVRKRTNFTQWLSVFQMHGPSPQDVRVSDNIYWFERLSLSRNSGSGTSLIGDISSDNTLGSGETHLTWNLANVISFPPLDPCPPN